MLPVCLCPSVCFVVVCRVCLTNTFFAVPLQTQNVVQFDFPRLAQLSVTCSLEASPQLADKLYFDLFSLACYIVSIVYLISFPIYLFVCPSVYRSSDLTELSLALFHEAKQEELGTGKTDAELINELVSTLVRKLPNLTVCYYGFLFFLRTCCVCLCVVILFVCVSLADLVCA